jgi:multimeric flavodoxin WrbA
MRILALNASPRRDGNSSLLLAAAVEGAVAAGHEVTSAFLGDHVTGVLDDCRRCRASDGACTIPDGYGPLLTRQVVPADGLLVATPLHYYGMTARLKAFFDRVFCYTSPAAPESEDVLRALPGKRIGLLVTSEETYPSATLGLVHQIQEIARYQRQHVVGVVQGHGNSRGDVTLDPSRPIDRARDLGRGLFTLPVSDYQFDTPRGRSVWAER